MRAADGQVEVLALDRDAFAEPLASSPEAGQDIAVAMAARPGVVGEAGWV